MNACEFTSVCPTEEHNCSHKSAHVPISSCHVTGCSDLDDWHQLTQEANCYPVKQEPLP